MRTNGHDSKRRGGHDAGSGTSATATRSGHGSTITGGNGTGDAKTKKTPGGDQPVKILFDPIDTTNQPTDCPDGVCPVTWATDTSGDNLDNKAWSTYLDKHREIHKDDINHPSHYTEGGIECIEAIEAQLTPEEFRGYVKGNCVKYLWREKHKGGNESLRKAQWYLNRLVDLQ